MPVVDAFGFADSEVISVTEGHEALVVHFSAAQVTRASDGQVLNGFLHGMVMTCHHPVAVQMDDACFGALQQGRLRQRGKVISPLPVPLSLQGPFELMLSFVNGSSCHVSGEGLVLEPTPDTRWTEWLKC